MVTYAQFLAIPTGTRIFNHGYDQCVALANHYNEGVLGGSFVPVGSAYQWWTSYGTLPQLHQRFKQVSKPVPGALFVARYGIYNGPDGHIGVVTSVNKDGTFNTMEQNTFEQRYVGRHTRSTANVLGFLDPINNPAGGSTSTKGLPMYSTYWTGPTGKNTHISGRIITSYGSFWVPNPQLMTLLQRRHDAALKPGAHDEMLDAEHDILNVYLKGCLKSAMTGIALDPTKQLNTINEELKKLNSKLVVTENTVHVGQEDLEILAQAMIEATKRIGRAMEREASQ